MEIRLVMRGYDAVMTDVLAVDCPVFGHTPSQVLMRQQIIINFSLQNDRDTIFNIKPSICSGNRIFLTMLRLRSCL